jgi:hypothetical protein
MIFSWSIALFLYQPGISGDQPWASRRLVPAVLPGFILLAVWAVAWAAGKLSRGEVPLPAWLGGLARWLAGSRRGLVAAAVAAACALLLVVPTAMGASGTALKRTFTGQVAAIYGICAQLPADASVLVINGPMADRWAEPIRGMCDVPVARFPDSANPYDHPTAPTALVSGAIASIEKAGRRPVLLAGSQQELAPFASGGTVTHAANIDSTQDGRYYFSAPTDVASENLNAWMWQPAR